MVKKISQNMMKQWEQCCTRIHHIYQRRLAFKYTYFSKEASQVVGFENVGYDRPVLSE